MRVSGMRQVWAAWLALSLCAGAAWGEVLGKTAQPLDAAKARQAECSLGDLAADAARSALRADLALIQASQLRPVTIPAGDLTRETLTAALLFPDEQVVAVEISGEQLLAALERSLSMLPKPSMAFLQVSGITVVFRSGARPGQRVVADRVKVGREVLSRSKKYRVAMPISLAKGALGYFRIFTGLKVEEAEQSVPLGQALCDHVDATGVIPPPAEPRLRDLSQPGE